MTISKRLLMLALLPLGGCMNGLAYDSGHGGILQQHYVSEDYVEIVQQANNYCRAHRMGEAEISKIHQGCMGCGTEYTQYEFKCGN